MPDYPDVVQYAVPGFIAAILLEFLWVRLKGRGGRFETRDALTSLIMGAGNVAEGLLLGFVGWTFLMALWAITPFDLGTSWWVVALCFVLDDLRYYWVHRLGHRSRWVWASHVNHHSSQHYNLTTALRQTWTGTVTFMVILRAPLVLMGFHPAIIVFVGGLNLIYQFWIHTEAIGRMPRWIEAVMNTPSHHRVHHGRNPRYLDSNYAGVFIVWDRLFGTFSPELEAEPVVYGLTKNLGTSRPWTVLVHGYADILRDLRRAGSFGAAWRYLLLAPGWSHDGHDERASVLRAEAGLS